ncbi:MAG: S24 family peptidase [Saprospiraceae bacterium]|nr:S24 family peptidase [Saprospiraceae bacterium]
MPLNVVTQRFIRCHNKLKEDNRIRSSRQFALSLDYLPQSLSEVLRGRRDVTIELLRKAVESYKINPVFIYTGEGPMFMSESSNESFRVMTIVTDASEEEKILHVPVPAQAGYAGENTDPTFIQELPSFTLPDYKYKSGTHRSFDVSGDSMEPTLFEGDKVVCSFLEPDLWKSSIKDNYVYVLVTRGDVIVKRVINEISEKKGLNLQSDNAFYDDQFVALADVREIWYARAKISPFLPSPKNLQNNFREEIKQLHAMISRQGELINDLSHSIRELNTEKV